MNRSSHSKGVQELDAGSFRDSVRHGVVLVHFAEPWCGLCGLQRPILERVAERVTGRARVASLNVDQAPDLAAHYGIETLPTLVLFKGGQVLQTFAGLHSETVLSRALLSAAGASAPLENQETMRMKKVAARQGHRRHGSRCGRPWSPASGPLLVHFRTGWSGPCRMLTPSLRAVARKLKGRLQTAEVNVDEHPELAAQYAITQVPTLVLLDHATPIERFTQTAGSKGQAYKLEGAWTLASEDGLLACMNLVPSDPSGHEATAQVHWVSVGQAGAYLMGLYEADTLSDTAWVARMVNRNTAQYTDLYYAIKTGVPNEIKGIAICCGTLTFDGPDRLVLSGMSSYYLPGRDANGDGLPDDLENPPDIGPVPHLVIGTRVPMVP